MLTVLVSLAFAAATAPVESEGDIAARGALNAAIEAGAAASDIRRDESRFQRQMEVCRKIIVRSDYRQQLYLAGQKDPAILGSLEFICRAYASGIVDAQDGKLR